VVATPTPENVATVAAQQLIESVYGTATPLPWGMIVITPIPPPVSPTATPLPPLLGVDKFTPTPTPLAPVIVPDVLPDFIRNKILFMTTRYGPTETYAFDPATGQLYKVTEPWIYPLAQQKVGFSPDGRQLALVAADQNRILQIYVRSFEYNTQRQLSTFNGDSPEDIISYDPAWSPRGDQIVFVSTNTGNDEIYTLTVDGSVQQQLTNNSFEWDKHPTWSPDGSRIVFYSNRDTGKRRLWIMNVDGSNQSNLSATLPPVANDQYEDWDPIWVP
jgi:TolB protein